ncbi:MAG: TIGR03016 family PEP-CTERM system-associated outer membrane protein [Deltaproteobacteria bacterium]|nr:TIGR03016 family PEP-CTERM system-associated outer membrane protein [Deltaproteobacteria bacterium]
MKRLFWGFRLFLGAALLLLPGQVQAAVEIHPRLTVSEEYNDNIDLVEDKDEDDDDFITVISPGILVTYNSAYFVLNGDYSLVYRKYRDHTEEDETEFKDIQRGLVSGDILPNHDFSIHVSNEWSRVVIDERRPSSEENLSENRTTLSHFIVNPRYRFRRIPTYELAFDYLYENLRYDAPEGDDYQSHEAGVELTKSFGPRLSASLGYRFRAYLGDDELENPDYLRHDAFAGLRIQLGPDLTLSGRGGKAWLKYDYDETMEDREDRYDTLIWSAAAEYRLSGRFVALLEYSEDFTDSVDEGIVKDREGRLRLNYLGRFPVTLEGFHRRGEYQLTDREEKETGGLLTATVPVMNRLSLLLGGDYSYHEYEPEGEEVDEYGGRAALELTTRYLTVTLSYAYREWDSNLEGESYTNNIAFLSARLHY